MSAQPTPLFPTSSPADRIHVFWHEGMLNHDTGTGVFDTGFDPGFLDILEKHPENSDRIKNMVSILERGPIAPFISWHSGRPAVISELHTFHTQGLAVQLALDSGCKKVVVVDIDVHYGNGTAEGFYRSNKVLTVSLHMNHGSWGPSHPQSGAVDEVGGAVDEVGEGEGFGYNMNVPLPNGTGDRGYKYAMTELIVAAVQKFEPDMMVLVVGQDSSAFDPNGMQCLTMEGFREIGQIIRSLADKHSDGRLLIVQEGGYHVTYSCYCLHATLEGVLNLPHPLLSDPIAYYPEDESFSVQVVKSIKQYQKGVSFLEGI